MIVSLLFTHITSSPKNLSGTNIYKHNISKKIYDILDEV